MTISAPLSGSADIIASFLGNKTAADCVPKAGAHRSQPDLCGQHGLADKPERQAQQILRKLLGEDEVRRSLMAKPRHLALCVSSGRALPCCNRSLQGHFAV